MKQLRFRCRTSRFTLLVPLGLVLVLTAHARPWRPDQIPNGAVFNCGTCHITSNDNVGGTPRNPFGQAVAQRVSPGSLAAFWDAGLAALDSDGDGFTNGEELGDPEGDFQNVGPANLVSRPGDATSTPPVQNGPPVFTSTPVSTATIGVPYGYQAEADDPDGDMIAFAKLAGPAWLNVNANGFAEGTPPLDSVGEITVTIRASDDAPDSLSAEQTFNLAVGAAFAGWRQLSFEEPENDALAGPLANNDGDVFPNILEYLFRLDPEAFDEGAPPSFEFDEQGRLTMEFAIRDDDPLTAVHLELSETLDFDDPLVIQAGSSDPDPDDGMQTLSFVDELSRDTVSRRFARIVITLPE